MGFWGHLVVKLLKIVVAVEKNGVERIKISGKSNGKNVYINFSKKKKKKRLYQDDYINDWWDSGVHGLNKNMSDLFIGQNLGTLLIKSC